VIPILLPIFLIITLAVDTTLNASDAKVWLKRMLKGVFLVWFIILVVGIAGFVNASVHNGVGQYTSSAWVASETVKYVRGGVPNGVWYSSDPYALYVLGGFQTKILPLKSALAARGANQATLDTMKKDAATGDAYLIVLDKSYDAYYVSFEDLQQSFALAKIHQFSDGAVYKLNLKSLQ
jgi:hypothetical protein